ncbi:phosphoesterase, PA-phosphatase related [Serinicoccus hydrothermalis]|uniref:Phosphoesterase, PA-phosphatase related n=1 Tax=Serinicoccus hydrothermalis TaxID=1758689 RepID=A0A1B1NC16_9MICO|nr:phosphatase PAP2 family protein [Serinicoccus hydrothermalis]ANS78979.1 phosphoesterase, PA-phosphatase related [Serinicoccus hydrothermalis]
MVSFRRLTSLPVLIGALVLVTYLAAAPLREFDRSLHGFWSDELTPRWTDFLDQVPNAVAGQAVCLPVLLLVAFTLAWKHRTWRPVLIAGATEAGFYGVVGGLKLVLARTSPKADDVSGRFFNGGAEEHGWYGMTYPSGHAAEAILIYGAAAYLLVVYSRPDSRLRRRLGWAMTLITINAVAVAYYLGYHWPSDLIGGMLTGAVVLRVIIDVDQWLARRRARAAWQRLERTREAAPVAPRPAPTPVGAASPAAAPAPVPPRIPAGHGHREHDREPELVP